MKTISIKPPAIFQMFDPFLFDRLLGMKHRFETKIIPLAKKKIKDCATGRRKEFERLLKQFMETYERKKIEEAEYDATLKAKTKRPTIPTSGVTARFRRFQPEESFS